MRWLDPRDADLDRFSVREAELQRPADTEVDLRRAEPIRQALRGGQRGPHLGDRLRIAATKDDLHAVIFHRDFTLRRATQKFSRIRHCSFSRWSPRASR